MSIAPIYFDTSNGRQDRPLLIFVEGTDDAHFVDVVLQDLGADPRHVGIIIVEGTPKFPNSIAMFKKSRNYRNAKGVALIRDADDDFAVAISDSNKIFLKEFELQVNHAQISSSDIFSVGLFVLPGNEEVGDLEKLCLATVAGTQLEIDAENYINKVQQSGILNKIYKRKAQVFLAGKPDDVCRGAGMGFKKGFFDKNHESLFPLKEFLSKFITLNLEVAISA